MRQSVQAAQAAFFISAAILLLAVLCTRNVLASGSVTARDYLLPGETSGGIITRSELSIQAASSKDFIKTNSLVMYRAFDGNNYNLLEHRGRHVSILVPSAPDSEESFTADHLDELVDQLDILYVLYSEILGAEPAGPGLLNFAFVPQTCGAGCGLLGSRGIEIRSETSTYQAIIAELDAGGLHPILMHEMAHNFDTLYPYLHYLPDHAHAWTDLFEYFAPRRYGRMGSRNEGPDELFDSPIRSAWKAYLEDPSASWTRCVRDANCPGLERNNLWAMLYYRVESLYGPEALLESFAYLREYARTQYPPSTEVEKESLRILSLAVGAGTNLACYLDEINWPVDASTRAEMERSFGSGEALCADTDGDGFSVFTGDCDDLNQASNGFADELPENGLDDDCDQLVDEYTLREDGLVDEFEDTVAAKLPTTIAGSSASLVDFDTFSFPLPVSGRVRVTLCADESFNGWAIALQPDGAELESENWFSYQSGSGCGANTFDYSGLAEGAVAVTPDSSTGRYQLTLSAGAVLQPDYSNLISVVPNSTGGVTVQFRDAQSALTDLGADELEFWVSGTGLNLVRPFKSALDIILNSQTTPALLDGQEYRVRVRARSMGAPLTAFSAGHVFRFDRTPQSLPPVDDRMSGTWFDPEHDGEGFVLEILEHGQAVVYWFTYDTRGRQRWMLGVGQVEDNRAEFSSLLHTEGARFGAAFDADDVRFREEGSLSITVLDCDTALVNYIVDGTGGDQSVTRLTHALGHHCGRDNEVPETDLSGSWFDPERNGEGFVVQQLNGETALVYWFTYDDQGRQAWMFNTGSVDGNRITFSELLTTAGGHFGRSFDSRDVVLESWGSLVLELDCEGGTASWSRWNSTDATGVHYLVPLSRLQNSGCL